MFMSETKRIFSRPLLYVSFIVGVLLINRPLLEAFFEPVDSASITQILSVPLALSSFSPFAAIFCALPFADSFCEDFNSGYIRSVVSRTGVKKYALTRCLSVALSGGLVMAGIITVTIIHCGILADSPDTPESISFMRNSIWMRSGIIFVMNGIPYLLLRVLFGFLFGCVWSLIGLLISTVLTNKYVTYIAPFILYQMLWFLLNETMWNPVYMLRGDSNFIPSIAFVIVYQMVLILILIFSSCLLIKRKVRR